jgi:hypothetical protein
MGCQIQGYGAWPHDLMPLRRDASRFGQLIGRSAGADAPALSASKFGFNAPNLVVTGAGIIAGHFSLPATCKLALVEVPVAVVDHLSVTRRRANVIAGNARPGTDERGREKHDAWERVKRLRLRPEDYFAPDA